MGNKADEQACLDFAVKACLAQHGISKRIGLLLSGEDIQRDNDERPDFMRLSTSSGDHGSVVLGIEHFRVDHFSRELTNNRVGSYGIGYEKNLKRSVNTWQPQISSDKEIPAGALKSIGELVAQLLSQQIQATYNSFISAFSYSLNKHLESIDFYHSQLERYAGNYEKKLAFLIEIHSDFHKLFFHDKNGTHYGEKTIPLFDELVTIMEKIDPRKVHYLILCFGDTVYNDSTKVIAVPTKNLRGHLAKRNIPIYHYAGHDICLSGFQTPRLDFKATSDYERQGDNIDFHITVASRDIKDEKKLEMVVDMYRYIKKIERKKLNYATTDLVEMFYEVFDEYFSKLNGLSTENIIQLIPLVATANKDKNDLKFLEFEKKWGIGDNNDETRTTNK